MLDEVIESRRPKQFPVKMRNSHRLVSDGLHPETLRPRRFPAKVRDGLVYKHDEPQVLEMEALKTRLAAAIGERSGLFSVPKVMILDLPAKTLILEFVPGLKNLHEIVRNHEAGCEEIFARAGRALATVHQELRLPADKVTPLPDYLMSNKGENVALHGDFFWGNVCCRQQGIEIVLLDWSGAPFLGAMCNYGSRYFDLVWFSWPFFVSMPPRQALRWPAERLVTALINGYEAVENSFRWEAYLQYRTVVRPVMWRFWKAKRKIYLSSPADTCADLLGWLRWLSFPRRTLRRKT
jgi:aminoglycoside phosphotransferase (APT) family kinase protein